MHAGCSDSDSSCGSCQEEEEEEEEEGGGEEGKCSCVTSTAPY